MISLISFTKPSSTTLSEDGEFGYLLEGKSYSIVMKIIFLNYLLWISLIIFDRSPSFIEMGLMTILSIMGLLLISQKYIYLETYTEGWVVQEFRGFILFLVKLRTNYFDDLEFEFKAISQKAKDYGQWIIKHQETNITITLKMKNVDAKDVINSLENIGKYVSIRKRTKKPKD